MKDRFSFRAWNKKEKKYIDDIQECDNGYGVGEPCRMCFGDYLYECETYEVEQCTGIKDKNGELIYEGDILQSTDGFFHQKYKVKWDREFSQFTLIGINTINTAFGIIDPDSLEVIGNIHENSELLEVE